MNIFYKYIRCFYFLVFFGYSSYISAELPSGTKVVYPNGTVYTGQNDQAQQQNYAPVPYGNTVPPYGYNYQGYNYFTSPPPPTPDEAFPDDAEQNALYNELQER